MHCIYTYVHMYNNVHSMVKKPQKKRTHPFTRAWAVNMAPKENCKVKCRPPPPVAFHGGETAELERVDEETRCCNVKLPKFCGVFFFQRPPHRKNGTNFLTLKSDLPSFFTAFAVSFPSFRVLFPESFGFSHFLVKDASCGLLVGRFFFSQVLEGLEWMEVGTTQQIT